MRITAILSCLVLFGLQPLPAAASPDSTFFEGIGKTALATGSAPGIALAVAYKGQIVYTGGFGFADVAMHRPVTADTPFAIGSLSKQLTAAAVMLLVREHKIALTDALSKYVPSLPNAKRITIRMLLDQNSGLHNYPLLSEHPWPTQGAIPPAKIVSILATDKPDFQPGTKWEYSNANYAALAAVVEKAGGIRFGTFLRTRIFEPLRMTDSTFGYEAQRSGSIAVGYVNGRPELPPLSLDLFSGAGAAVSSARDLAQWDLALTQGRLLPSSYLSQVWHEGVPTGQGSERYTMGWVIDRLAGHRELWHNGLTPGVGGYCYNALFPDDGLAVVVLTNGFDARGLPERMTQQIAAAYGIGTPPQPAAAPTGAPGDNPAIDALARDFWNQIASGTIDRSKLTPEFSAALTPGLLAQVQQGIAAFGPLKFFTFVGSTAANGVNVYRYGLTFSSGAEHEWDVAIAPDGRIAGSHLVN